MIKYPILSNNNWTKEDVLVAIDYYLERGYGNDVLIWKDLDPELVKVALIAGFNPFSLL